MHRATKASTSASASIGERVGWATPTTRDHKDGSSDGTVPINGLLGRQVWQAGWSTPTAQDSARGTGTIRPHDTGHPLPQQASLVSGWNTPRATDGSNGGPNQGGGALSHDAAMAGWPTPRTSDTNGSGAHGDGGLDLRTTAQLAGWPTPLSAPDSEASHNQVSGQFRRAMAAAMPESIGSGAETGSTGRLRAGHSRWLMRIPSEWDDCVPTGTRSTRAKRKAS